LAEGGPRLFSPYGYYEDKTRLVPSVILSCLKGRSLKLASKDSVRDFVFIGDVMDAYVKAAENIGKAAGEIFNIGYGRQHCVREIVDTVIKITSSGIKPGWGKVFNPRFEPKKWQADISKARALLNWQPEYDLASGLSKTINWLKNHIVYYQG